MAKYADYIGYAITKETSPGVWTEHYTEQLMCGDLLSDTYSRRSDTKVNDDITMSNRISVIAHPEQVMNAMNIRYARYMGMVLKVTSIDVKSPRLILTLGGVYNGEQASTT